VTSVILGATSVAQLRENLGALAVAARLTAADAAALEAAAARGKAPGGKLREVAEQVTALRGVAALANVTF